MFRIHEHPNQLVVPWFKFFYSVFEPNLDAEELYNASNNPMTVNGTVLLTATFNGKTKLINGHNAVLSKVH